MKTLSVIQTFAVTGILAAGIFGGWFILSAEPTIAADPHGDHDEQDNDDEDAHDDVDEDAHDDVEAEDEPHAERAEISDAAAARAGVVTGIAGPRQIAETISVTGFISPDPKRVAQVTPRYSGSVLEVLVNPGEHVEVGQTLAQVENQATGVAYPVISPLAGEVVEIHLRPGELADDESHILVADLSEVWAQLRIFNSDQTRIKQGQTVEVSTLNGSSTPSQGVVSYISPIASSGNQSRLARVVLDNRDGDWSPGLYVNAIIEFSRQEVPISILRPALQSFEGSTVAFVKEGETYEARPLQIGRQDTQAVEVISGLVAGEEYVTQNAFLIKADILKSGAAHQH